MKKFLVPLLLAAIAGPALAASQLDGIQTGLPLAQQMEAIAKLNPAYRVSEIKPIKGQIKGVQAVVEKNGRVTDNFVALEDASGIVWFIGRARALEPGERMKQDALVDTLMAQYGHYTDLTAGFPRWQFDRDGNLYQGPPIKGPCYGGFGHGVVAVGRRVAGFGEGMTAPKTFSATCGAEIRTAIRKASGGMVAAYSVRVVDARRMYDQLHPKTAPARHKK